MRVAAAGTCNSLLFGRFLRPISAVKAYAISGKIRNTQSLRPLRLHAFGAFWIQISTSRVKMEVLLCLLPVRGNRLYGRSSTQGAPVQIRVAGAALSVGGRRHGQHSS